MRRHFVRRVGLFIAAFFGLMFAANAIAFFVFSDRFGPGERRGPILPAAILGLVLLLLGFTLVRRFVRRTAAPIGDVMEAADRVAGGDYSARVEAQGPGEMRRLARSFNAMAERLESNEAQRRNFLADVAHELRTPLSVIRGNVEGMMDGLYPADEPHLRPVLEETAVMSRLLEDLQTLSMAEAGVLRLHRDRVHPPELVQDAVAAFRADAAAAGVTLEARLAPGLPEIDVDPIRIGQVFANLLSNAVRLTPSGGTVVVAAEPSATGVSFSVSDTGPGIDSAEIARVFDRFVKSADSGGVGLGLAIAKSLVDAHGGEIGAESEPGRGTTMRFTLPSSP